MRPTTITALALLVVPVATAAAQPEGYRDTTIWPGSGIRTTGGRLKSGRTGILTHRQTIEMLHDF